MGTLRHGVNQGRLLPVSGCDDLPMPAATPDTAEDRTLASPPIVLDRAAAAPLYRQIELQLRAAILERRLRPGTALPGIRAFARELGVAAITVITAYDQLTAEGYLEPRPGRGTLVASDIPAMQRLGGGRRPAGRTSGILPGSTAAGPVEPFFARGWPAVRYDFRTGSTRFDLFPARAWERALGAAWRDLATDASPASGYGEPAGDPRLRAELASYLGRSRAVRAEADQVVITNGAQGAMAVGGRMWLAGRTLAVEDPGSPHLQRTFTALGVRLAHVPVDDRGLPVDRLPGDASGVLVTPSWQYPRGGTMPVARRLQLLDWAAARRALIIEDDCDSELRYQGHPLPSLQGLDPEGRVLYVGTFSKVLFPGLRTGYAVIPEPAVDPFVAQLEAAYRGPSALEQRALALFIADGHFERHLARLRTAFAERQAALVAALASELGRIVSTAPAPGGAHLVVRIEDGRLSATQLAARARALDVAIEPLVDSAHHPIADRDFLMHYGRLRPDEIRGGVERLARAATLRTSRASA
jgi:GntR family transcriptional regulator/MocR family aminotransferase